MFGRRAIHPVDVEMGPSSNEVLKRLQNEKSVVLAKKNILLAQARQSMTESM